MARASIAAQRRRARSSSTGSRLVYFVLMVWTGTFRMQTILPIEGENWISYSGETPMEAIVRACDPEVNRCSEVFDGAPMSRYATSGAGRGVSPTPGGRIQG